MKNFIIRIVIVAIFLILTITIINLAPEYDLVYKYKNGDLRVIVNDVEITRDTSKLPQVAVLLNGEVMLSRDTIDILFDKDLFYDQKYETYITTSNIHRADIVVGRRNIIIDNKERAIKVPAVHTVYKYNEDDRYNGSIATKEIVYFPIKELEEVYNISVEFDGKIIITELDKDRSRAYVNGEEPLEIKYSKDANTKVVERVNSGGYVDVFNYNDSSDYNLVRSNTGEIGYVDTTKLRALGLSIITSSPIVEKDTKMIRLAWDYLNPDVSGIGDKSTRRRIDQLDIVAPTILYLQNTTGEVTYRVKTADEYKSWAQKCGYDVWVTFKNDSNSIDDTSAFLNDMYSRSRAINQLLEYCEKYNTQGINIDFENMYKKDAEVFSQFIRELAVETRKKGLVLSVCVNIPDGSETWSLCYQHKSLSESADYIAVMTYDQNNGASTPGPNASYDWVEDNIEKLVKRDNVDPNKLLLGLAFYSRYWSYKGGKLSQSVMNMEKAKEYIPKAKWNDTAKQYFYETNNSNEQLWIEDATSIKEKYNLITQYGLGGFSGWRLGFETNDVWKALGE